MPRMASALVLVSALALGWSAPIVGSLRVPAACESRHSSCTRSCCAHGAAGHGTCDGACTRGDSGTSDVIHCGDCAGHAQSDAAPSASTSPHLVSSIVAGQTAMQYQSLAAFR